MILLLLAALAAEPVLLDGGPGPVQDGFARLDLLGSTDARVRWKQPPLGVVTGDFPDALAGDAVVGGVLHLDLPPGRYHLWVMLGMDEPSVGQITQPFGLRSGEEDVLRVTPATDWASWSASSLYTVNPWPRFVPGETAWDRVVAPTHVWREADVVVRGAGLTLAPFGRPIQALVVGEEGEVDALRARLAEVDGARRAWFHDHHAPHLRDEVPPFATGPARVALADWDALPDPAAPDARWAVRLARGDRQGTVAWVLPGDAPVEAEVRGLRGLSVELYGVGWLDAAQHATRAQGVRPALLVPGPSRGGQGLPVGTAIVVSAPPGARAGLRRGVLRLTSGGQRFDVPLEVTVLDLDLPLAPVPSGFIVQLSAAATLLDGHGAPSVRALIHDDLARMRTLGAEAITLKGTMLGTRFPDGDPAPAIALTRELIADWAAMGGRALQWADPKVELHTAGFVHPERDALAGRLAGPMQQLLTAVRDAPLPVVVGLWEEEGGWKNADALRLAQQIVPQIRALAPYVRLGASAGHPEDWEVAGLIDVVAIGNLPTLRRASVERVRALGGAPWAYNLAPGRTGPLAAWAAGVEAYVQWHWSPKLADPLNDVHELPFWWYAVHGPDGQVWHSPLAERFAQGIVDTRYLALLEARAAAAADHRSASVRARAAAATALIADVRASLDGALASSAWDGEMLAPGALDGMRELVIQAALGLPAE